MDTFWFILVVFLAFFFVLVILPNLVATPPLPIQQCQSRAPIDVSYPELANDQNPRELEKTWETEEIARSKQMLDQQFVPASRSVPVDHPRKPIGACPFSKPLSSDLPIANMPMQLTVKSNDMRLGSCSA
jgi:hypothetical protein